MNIIGALSLEETAKECGMSLSCFQRAFKREIGMTFCKYVNMLRIARAKRLLHDNHRSMSQIAFDCGFSNQYHVTRTFKKLINTPPRSFRKALFPEVSPKTMPA
jgi:AraC family transcriptional regulator